MNLQESLRQDNNPCSLPVLSEEAMEKNREEQRQEQIGQKPAADDSESRLNDQDPGERQKENQNQQKEDALAA
jgi:hypothetical protein